MSDIPYQPDDSSDDLSIRPVARALPPITFSEKHRRLKASLMPLTNAQLALEARLGHASLELQSTSVNTAAPFDVAGAGTSDRGRRGPQEFSINSSNGWKSALNRFRTHTGQNGKQESGNSSPTTPTATSRSNGKAKASEEEEILEVIASCREDIKELWEDQIVGEVLNRRKVRLEDGPGLCVQSLFAYECYLNPSFYSFINDAERIARTDYQPTDDDVIRARLRTLGVQEYKFIFDHGTSPWHSIHLNCLVATFVLHSSCLLASLSFFDVDIMG